MDRTTLRAVLSGGLNCSSFFAARIQKKQPLLEAAEGKNIMYHKWAMRKHVSYFVLVLCFNDPSDPVASAKGPVLATYTIRS